MRNTTNPTFEDLVARNAERGLTGDAIYDAIVDTSTHSRMAPGSLSDIETGAVYSQFELGMRALDEQMVRDGVGIEDRARTLSGLRSSLRAWTRELMENRPAADWLSAHESAPTFEDLVARYEGKGLSRRRRLPSHHRRRHPQPLRGRDRCPTRRPAPSTPPTNCGCGSCGTNSCATVSAPRNGPGRCTG